jgi:hypothetical protein
MQNILHLNLHRIRRFCSRPPVAASIRRRQVREPQGMGDRQTSVRATTMAHTPNPAPATAHGTPVYPRATMSPTQAKTIKPLIGPFRGDAAFRTSVIPLSRIVYGDGAALPLAEWARGAPVFFGSVLILGKA